MGGGVSPFGNSTANESLEPNRLNIEQADKWLGDGILDPGFGREMEETFLEDLKQAKEIKLPDVNSVGRSGVISCERPRVRRTSTNPSA